MSPLNGPAALPGGIQRKERRSAPFPLDDARERQDELRTNPRVPWEGLRPLRGGEVQLYDRGRRPVNPARVWRFVRTEVSTIVRRLRSAVYPAWRE